jgi:hypothetical protein
MCPACLAAAATSVVSLAAGASSVGGVAAVIAASLAGRTDRGTDEKPVPTEGEDNGAAENRFAR